MTLHATVRAKEQESQRRHRRSVPAEAGRPRALDDEEFFVIKGSHGAQLRDNQEERLIAAITAMKEGTDKDVDELHVRNLGSFLHCHDEHLSLHATTGVQQACP